MVEARNRCRWLLAHAAGAALLVPAAPAAAKEGSLYSGPGPRPGPDLLYAKPAKAPQLKNTGPWRARPILISGASAYRKGEFLYQDYLYDDHGAQGTARDADDPRSGSDSFSGSNGTYTYPSDPDYAFNAADLVEFRVKPRRRHTAFRVTLNTMLDPELVGITIALGDSASPQELPHDANATAPARRFLTIHGDEAELVRAGAEAKAGTRGPDPKLNVSPRRNQVTVRVPHSAWNPRSRTVRIAAGVGLWDAAADAYLLPASNSNATTPGGAAGLAQPTAFFNVAFRPDEPYQKVFPFDTVLSDPAWWRDRLQGEALKTGDLGAFHADVDFGKLRRGVRDDMRDEPGGVPTHGPMNRVLSSRFRTGEGQDWSQGCGQPEDCVGEFVGRLQPYAIYVPDRPPPAAGWGSTLLAHSLGASYNQFSGNRNQSQLGDRGQGSIVFTPEGRGPDGWYWGHAGADSFEVWADVARRYPLDPRSSAISGYSMGGYATYKFTTQFPDLFGAAQPVVGPPGLGVWAPPADPQPGGAASNTNRMLASVRNIPFLIWNGTVDELVPVAGATAQAQTFDDLDYRYEYDLFTTSDHFALAVNDQYAPAAEFLGKARVNRNPAHVTYVVNPAMDFPELGTAADHAYWLSKLRLRDGDGAAPLGKVDAVSHGFGEGDPVAGATEPGPGALTGGNIGPMAYVSQSKAWGEAPAVPAQNRLTLDLENLKRVVVHVKRARLSCDPDLDVTSDGPAKLRLAGCGRTVEVG